MPQTIVDYYLVDLVVQRALQWQLKSYPTLKISLGRFLHYCPPPDLPVISRTRLHNFHTYDRQVSTFHR